MPRQLLRRLRFHIATPGENRRRWRVTRGDVVALAKSYGISLPQLQNADNADNAETPTGLSSEDEKDGYEFWTRMVETTGPGVCCAGRSAPSQCGVVTGPGFSLPNQPHQVRTTAYHDSSGPNSRSDAHSAINCRRLGEAI